MYTIVGLIFSFIIMFINKSVDFAPVTFLAVIAIIVCSITFTLDISSSHLLSRYNTPIIIGYFWRLVLLVFDIYGKNIYHLPGSGGDSEGFFEVASLIANGGYDQYGRYFTLLMGGIFKISGISRLWGQYIVMLFSVVAIIFLVRTLVELDLTYEVINRAVYIVALLPNFAILSSIFLRESIVCMFCTFSLYFFVLWLVRKKEVHYIFALIAPIGGAIFHSGVIGLTVGMALARFLYDNKTSKISINAKGLIIAGVLLLAFAFVFLNYGEQLLGKIYVTSTEEIASGTGRGGSDYSRYVGSSASIFSMIIFTIPRYLYYLFSPFPWQWRGLSDIIAFVFSSLFYILTCVDVIRYIRYENTSVQKPRLIVIFIVVMAVTFIYAWGVSNTGTAVRHRDKVFPWFVVLYALAHDDRKGVHLMFGNQRIL